MAPAKIGAVHEVTVAAVLVSPINVPVIQFTKVHKRSHTRFKLVKGRENRVQFSPAKLGARSRWLAM